jgi:hypothetical protein
MTGKVPLKIDAPGEHGVGVADEMLAFCGQGDGLAGIGVQEGGADDGSELADLASEGGMVDAEVAGGVVEPGVCGSC